VNQLIYYGKPRRLKSSSKVTKHTVRELQLKSYQYLHYIGGIGIHKLVYPYSQTDAVSPFAR
jgi:hypothetical protein